MTDDPKPPADPVPEATETFIFRPWRKLPDGTILWAKNFGKKAWKIPVSAATPTSAPPTTA